MFQNRSKPEYQPFEISGLLSIVVTDCHLIEIYSLSLCRATSFLQNHIEGYHELSTKTQTYFSTAVAKWDADFYIKVDDDVHINLG